MRERLQKIISNAGIMSRRGAEQLIREGRISVNGTVVRELGTKAGPEDEIRIDGKLIATEVSKVYLMVNKPGGYVTTLRDPEGRPIITDLTRGIEERIFPVGRLDYDSEGLIFMTNDGDFANRLQHPKFKVSKTYLVKIKGGLSRKDVLTIREGVDLEDGKFAAEAVQVEKSNDKSCWVRLTIFEGRNRVIRRLFDKIGHPVARLIRTAIGDIVLGNLKTGEYRSLKSKEIQSLLRISG